MMADENINHIFTDILSGEISDKRINQVEKKFQTSLRLQRELGRQIYIDSLLACEFGRVKPSEDITDRILSRISELEPVDKQSPLKNVESNGQRGRYRYTWDWYRWYSIAAMVLIMVGISVFYSRWSERAVPHLDADIIRWAPNGVTVIRNGKGHAVRSGMTLFRGDRIETGGQGGVRIAYEGEATWIETDAHTRIVFAGNRDGKALILESGAMYINAAPQPADRPMVVNPNQPDQAIVEGTAFEMNRTGDTTVLKVEKGSVRFGVKNESVVCKELQSSRIIGTSMPTEPLAVKPEDIGTWRRKEVAERVSRKNREWFVRPFRKGDYGKKNGTSYENAWDGFGRIVWGPGGVQAGDTLYVCGFHTGSNGHYLVVGASGMKGAPIRIDGGYPGDPGMIFGSYRAIKDGWTGPDTFGAYRCPHKGLNNGCSYEDTGATGDPEKFKRLIRRTGPPDDSWKPGSAWVCNNYETGDRFTYYKPSKGVPTDHVLYNESGGGIHVSEQHHVTIRNLRIWGSNTLLTVSGSHHVRIENCDLRWGAHRAIGIQDGSDSGSVVDCHIREVGGGILAQIDVKATLPDTSDHWYVAGNHIHHINDGMFYSKKHNKHRAVSFQGGSHNVIERNQIHHGSGPMIQFRVGGSNRMVDNVVRYNFLRDNRISRNSGGYWLDSCIAFDSFGTLVKSKGNRVHHNILVRSGNKGIYVKMNHDNRKAQAMGIFNNVLYGTSGNPEEKNTHGSLYVKMSKHSCVIRNNISFNSDAYHVYRKRVMDKATGVTQLDHNLYWNNNGKNTYCLNKSLVHGLAEWRKVIAAAGMPDERHSMERDPGFVNTSGSYSKEKDFTPRWDSPLIDAGTANTPGGIISRDILGNPIYGTPDIGAIEYQPPYTMGQDMIDIAANVRIYANGRFRNTAVPAGKIANLIVRPANGWRPGNRREWLNIAITRWEHNGNALKSWQADLKYPGTLSWSVGDLTARSTYVIYITLDGHKRTRLTTCIADGKGAITFTCRAKGGRSLYEIELKQ